MEGQIELSEYIEKITEMRSGKDEVDSANDS